MTTTVYIAIDDEGMLGNSSQDEISRIDVAESYSNYLSAVEKKVKAAYPGVKVETSVGSTTYATRVTSDELSLSEIDEMTLDIQEIGGRVYENGAFWAEKK